MLLRAPTYRIDDRFEMICRFCEDLEGVWSCPVTDPWTLNLTEVSYLGPDAAALICAAYLRARAKGQNAKVFLPTSPPALRAFCHFSGLSHYIDKGKRPEMDHPDCETVPLDIFFQAVPTQSLRITELIARHAELTSDEEIAIGACVSEVTQNIEDHAESSIGGVMCARYMSQSREIRVAVVDHGKGIAESLSGLHPGITAQEALRLVFRGGVSAKSLPRNMGHGISNLAGIVRTLGGELVVLTQNGVVRAASGLDPTFGAATVHFPGTAVFFKLQLGSRERES